MDPNSIAGLTKKSVDSGSNKVNTGKNFDAGGVSGAEMVGSVVTVLFGNGTFASTTISVDGSQSGGQAVVAPLEAAPVVSVNGVTPGGYGTYGGARPSIVVTATPGSIVRTSLVKAFNPVGNSSVITATSTLTATSSISVKQLVAARLTAQYPTFPVNNAVEWQHVDVTVPSSGVADLTASFNYASVTVPNDASSPFAGDDVLPLAFTAVTIDPSGRPLSETSRPIRLVNSGSPVP